jgi:hypothetical protein
VRKGLIEWPALELRHAAGWSSQVARRAHNPEVAGSNPAPATPERGRKCGPFLLVAGSSTRRSVGTAAGTFEGSAVCVACSNWVRNFRSQVLLPNGRWLPISVRLGVEDRQLQRLQVDALQLANAELQEEARSLPWSSEPQVGPRKTESPEWPGSPDSRSREMSTKRKLPASAGSGTATVASPDSGTRKEPADTRSSGELSSQIS